MITVAIGEGGNTFAFAIGTGSSFGFVTKDSMPVRNTTAILETEGFAPAILHLNVEGCLGYGKALLGRLWAYSGSRIRNVVRRTDSV